MPDDPSPSVDAPAPAVSDAHPAPRAGFLRRHWGKLTLAMIVLVPVAIFAAWAGVALGFTYSSGERVGFVQKLALKGWVCKTWEGELQMSNIPGSAPVIFAFTVRGDSLAHAIEASEGRQVALKYEQHVGLPTRCFGDTEYFVTGMRLLSPTR